MGLGLVSLIVPTLNTPSLRTVLPLKRLLPDNTSLPWPLLVKTKAVPLFCWLVIAELTVSALPLLVGIMTWKINSATPALSVPPVMLAG